MASLPFLNQNDSRKFPLVDTDGDAEMVYSGGGVRVLPNSAILDCLVVVGVDIPFADDDRVYLFKIVRSGNTFTFTFRVTTHGFEHAVLEFCRRLGDPEFTVGHAESSLAGQSASISETVDECEGLLLEGWLTTGSLVDLATVLPTGKVLYGTSDLCLEPGRVQSLYQSFVKSFSLANESRTVATSPEGCAGSDHAGDAYVARAFCLTGRILFREGYNTQIIQDPHSNAIIIGGAVGNGLGEPCEEVALVDGEPSPDGGQLLSGGPHCNEIIKTINGLQGPRVSLKAGAGVRAVVDGDDPHTLELVFDFNGLAICEDGP